MQIRQLNVIKPEVQSPARKRSGRNPDVVATILPDTGANDSKPKSLKLQVNFKVSAEGAPSVAVACTFDN